MRTRYVALGLAVAIVVAVVGGWAVVSRRDPSGSPAERAAKSVHDAHPVLLPSKIPASWKAEAKASRSFFTVTYTAAGGSPWVRLAIAVPNPPLPQTSTAQRTMKFRGDAKASYQVDGEDRLLTWRETGRWTSHIGGEGSDAVPYELTGHGVDEAQFLSIAGSLRSVS